MQKIRKHLIELALSMRKKFKYKKNIIIERYIIVSCPNILVNDININKYKYLIKRKLIKKYLYDNHNYNYD